MQGVCLHYLSDNVKLNPYEKALYLLVFDQTFRWGKRYAYIKLDLILDELSLSQKTYLKYKNSLESKGIIKTTRTKSYTCFQILEPANEIKRFLFDGRERKKNEVEKENEGDGYEW